MKRALSMLLVLVLVLSIPVMAYAATAVPNSVIQATESVVRIFSEYRYDVGSGSGFVVKSGRSETLIATNYHVVEGSPLGIYIVSREGELLDARILAYDKNKDLCILSLDKPISMKALRFDTKPRQGEAVYAVGYPAASDAFSDQIAYKSEEATITDGIISSLRQFTVDNRGNMVSALQISAAINPGNSGGPLLNAKGQVLGIDTWGIDDSQGIFGAVAISELVELAADNGIRLGGAGLAWVWIAALAVLVIAALIVVLLRLRARKPAGRFFEGERTKKLNLYDYIERLGRPLLPQEAVSLLMPAMVQLKELHEKGRAHLQLRPESIEISRKSVRLIEPKPGEANYYTIGFSAPELYKGKNYGGLTDIYSMCAVLLYAVTGINPKIEPDGAPGPEGEFMEILSKGMAAEYTERYGSVQELIFKLSPYNFPSGAAREVFQSASDKRPERAPREKRKKAERPQGPWSAKKKVGFAALIVLVLLLGCVEGYFACYMRASSLADEGRFSEAQSLLFLPSVTKLHDEMIFQYVEAGLLFEQEDYNSALTRFSHMSGYRNADTMVKECYYYRAEHYIRTGDYVNALKYFKIDALKGYRDTEAQIESLTEIVYQEGIERYRAGKYSEARSCFKGLGSYRYSERYMTLIDCRTNSDIAYYYKDLIKIINFEDAKDVLVANADIAVLFLRGDWKTISGTYYFKMNDEESVWTNLPSKNLYNAYYDIENGIYTLTTYKTDRYGNESVDQTVKTFKITVLTEDSIEVYCYYDSRYYTLYRW